MFSGIRIKLNYFRIHLCWCFVDPNDQSFRFAIGKKLHPRNICRRRRLGLRREMSHCAEWERKCEELFSRHWNFSFYLHSRRSLMKVSCLTRAHDPVNHFSKWFSSPFSQTLLISYVYVDIGLAVWTKRKHSGKKMFSYLSSAFNLTSTAIETIACRLDFLMSQLNQTLLISLLYLI